MEEHLHAPSDLHIFVNEHNVYVSAGMYIRRASVRLLKAHGKVTRVLVLGEQQVARTVLVAGFVSGPRKDEKARRGASRMMWRVVELRRPGSFRQRTADRQSSKYRFT